MEEINVQTVEIPLAGRAKELCMVALDFKIVDDETLGNAADLTRQIKAAYSATEELRDQYTRPLFTAQREYNDQFKAVTDPLKESEILLKALIQKYQAAALAKQREVEALQRQEQLKAEAEAAEKNEPPPPPLPPPPKPGPIRGSYGSKATIKERWVFELVDKTMIPFKYLAVDEKAIRASIKAGEREIAGLRIYNEGSVAIS